VVGDLTVADQPQVPGPVGERLRAPSHVDNGQALVSEPCLTNSSAASTVRAAVGEAVQHALAGRRVDRAV